MTTVEDQGFNFSEELDKSFGKLRVGDQITGVITGIAQSEVQVDIGPQYAGYIAVSELIEQLDAIKVGDELEVAVVKIHDADGLVELSRKRIVNQSGFNEIKEAVAAGTILTGLVTAALDAGVFVVYKGVKVFIHNSQTDPPYTNTRALIGTEVPFKSSFVDERRRSAKGSIRIAKLEKKTAATQVLWQTIEVGQQYEGIVKSLVSFGAFVDIGGVDGLVHISDIAWKKVQQIESFFNVGDKILVRVKSLDPEHGRISLIYKKDEDNPWVKAESQFKEGDTVEVPILLIKNFGVFVGIVPGIDGFIHISELSTEFIQAPAKIFNVGDIVKAKILEMNKEKQRIKLSVKAAQEGSPAESAENSTDSTDPQDQKDENTPENEPAC